MAKPNAPAIAPAPAFGMPLSAARRAARYCRLLMMLADVAVAVSGALVLSIGAAIVESALCLAEFVFGLLMCKDGLKAAILYANALEADTGSGDVDPASMSIAPPAPRVLSVGAQLGVNLCANAIVILWICFRFGNSLGIGPIDVLFRLGIHRPRISKWALALISLHATGLGIMALMQHFAGRWMFSLVNYTSKVTGSFDYAQAIEMLVLAPIREEILFRGILFAIAYKRVGGMTVDAKRNVILLNSLIFGLIHILNSFGTKYGPSYIALQIALGSVIGLFYSLRFMCSATIIEPIVLHAANNLFSSFLPLDMYFDLTDWLIAVPLLMTICVYSTLLYLNWPAIRERSATTKRTDQQISAVTNTQSTATSGPAAAAADDDGDGDGDDADGGRDSNASAPAASSSTSGGAATNPKRKSNAGITKKQLQQTIASKRSSAPAAATS